MNSKRTALLAGLAATALVGVTEVPAAPSSPRHGAAAIRHGGAALSHGAFSRPIHAGGYRYRPGVHGHGGYWGHSGWAWGLGLAIGVPLLLGLHDPYWGPAYYPPYAYGPVTRHDGNACERDEDCWREYLSRSEPAPPTTEVSPVAPGEEGGPTQRPLHLNYCDSARAWFPHVRTCAGGWRLVLPDYGAAR